MGLVFGWLRSVRPTFGRIPEPALWVFDTVGLAVFIAVIGLNTGPGFVTALRATGPSLLLIGFLVALTPHVTALLFGRYVLNMNPVILLGACAGAGTATAALRWGQKMRPGASFRHSGTRCRTRWATFC